MSNKDTPQDHVDIYDRFCKGRFQDLADAIAESKAERKEQIGRLETKIDTLVEGYIGNGKPGVRADVNWCKGVCKGILWVVTPIGLVFIGYTAKVLLGILLTHKPIP
jgi:hypothetical protein